MLFAPLLWALCLTAGVSAQERAQRWDVGACRTYEGDISCIATNAVTATLREGVLTFSGSGGVRNFAHEVFVRTPWYEDRASITKVVIENGVTAIGRQALYGLPHLTTIVVGGKNAITVGADALQYCTSLKVIEYLSPTPSEMTGEGIQGMDVSRMCLFVPPGSTSTYRTAETWSSFACVEELGKSYAVSFVAMVAMRMTPQVVPAGGKIAKPIDPVHPAGYTFMGWYKEEALTNTWNFDKDVVTRHTILYAKWSRCPEGYRASGYTGSLTWILCNRDLLVVNGEGDMPNHLLNASVPWNSYLPHIKSVALDTRLTRIGSFSFYGCDQLAEITIPERVTRIGDYAFQGCRSLTSIAIPDNVVGINNAVFRGCTGLTSVSIGSSVASISTYAFYGCTALAEITLPDNVATVGSSAFQSCTALSKVTLGSGVTNISTFAFGGCTALTEVTVLATTPPLASSSVFSDVELSRCTLRVPHGFAEVYRTAGAPWSSFGTIQELPFGAQHVVFFNTRGGTPILPQVVSTGSRAVAPAAPTHLGYTFAGWYTNETCTGEQWSFDSEISSNTMLYAKWDGCPGGLTAYGDRSTRRGRWSYCDGNKTLTLNGEGAMHAYGSAEERSWHAYSSAVEQVKLDSRITYIGSYVFHGFTNLKSIALPGGVTTIGDRAFYGCSRLRSVTLPGAVTTIGDHAFADCSSLDTVVGLRLVAPTISSNTFTGVKESCCVYVLQEALSDYHTSMWSSYFSCIKATNLRGYRTVTFDSQHGSSVIAQVVPNGERAQRPAAPTRSGFAFVGWYREAAGVNEWDFNAAVTGNMVLYAKWVQLLTVTYNAMGGSNVMAQRVVLGQPVAQPAAPTRVGYAFAGWHRDQKCTVPWTFNSAVNQSMMLYAKWVQRFVVTFNVESGSTSTIPAQLVALGSKVQKPADPTRPGFTFGGWYREAAHVTPWNFDTDTIPYSIILFAKWVPVGK